MANIFETNKHTARLLNWLQSGASKEGGRLALTGVLVGEDQSISTDGFRAHAVSFEEFPTGGDFLPTGLRKFPRIPAKGGTIIEPDTTEGVFPDVSQVIPSGEPVFRIAANAKRLVDALKGFQDQRVVLTFYGDKHPFEITGSIETSTKDDTKVTPAYALIMPMHIDLDAKAWRPFQNKPKLEEGDEPHGTQTE